MKFTHFLYCPFTGLGLYQGYRGDTWLRNRIKIFNQFVLPSILNQSNQNFTLWVSWRSEEKNNPIVEEFKAILERIRGLKFIFTYGGLCFYDDKYDDETAYNRLKYSLKQTLPELSDIVKDSDYVLMTIQPSDDMYTSDAIEFIQKWLVESSSVGLGFNRGYMINYATKEIAEYNPITYPPFYTIKFSKEKFLDATLHMKFTGPYKSHEYVKECLGGGMYMFYYPTEFYPPTDKRKFIVGTHGENISTNWNHPFMGKKLLKEEAEKVLMDTGNLFTEPIVVIKDKKRIWMKKLLNILPLFIQRRIICYLSKTSKVAVKNYKWFNI